MEMKSRIPRIAWVSRVGRYIRVKESELEAVCFMLQVVVLDRKLQSDMVTRKVGLPFWSQHDT
jgi:hypothetical protein